METTTCRPVGITRGLSSSRARATNFPMGAPQTAVGGVGTKSCLWTRTMQGSTRRLEHPGNAWWGTYLGKEG